MTEVTNRMRASWARSALNHFHDTVGSDDDYTLIKDFLVDLAHLLRFRAMDEGKRRKNVYPDDLVKYHKVWDKKLEAAFKYYPKVVQPLAMLLSEETRHLCHQIAVGDEKMSSILTCYFDPSK